MLAVDKKSSSIHNIVPKLEKRLIFCSLVLSKKYLAKRVYNFVKSVFFRKMSLNGIYIEAMAKNLYRQEKECQLTA